MHVLQLPNKPYNNISFRKLVIIHYNLTLQIETIHKLFISYMNLVVRISLDGFEIMAEILRVVNSISHILSNM